MRLTRFTDLSLRVLVYLGLRPGERVTIRCIAEAYGVSRNHLMKVVSALTRAGYVTAHRGPGGGLELARAPEDINLADVVADTEDDMQLVECFGNPEGCVISEFCALRGILGDALEAFMNALGQHDLGDLLGNERPLKNRLGIPTFER